MASKYKIVLIGNSCVGKSAMMVRFTEDDFRESMTGTIGIDFKMKDIALAGGDSMKLQVWDTAGHDRFRTITSSFYRGAHGIMVVYDITNRQTFRDVRIWLSEIEKYASGSNVSVLLIAAKDDLEEDRDVSREEGEAYAAARGIPFFETSSKTNHNVHEAFQELAEMVYERNARPGGSLPPISHGAGGVDIAGAQSGGEGDKKKKKCCGS